ncbi:MAG: cytochrome b [Rhizobacter sp.]
MSARPSPSRYTATAIVLHWVLAAGIVALFVEGLYMTGLPLSPAQLKLFNWHKWAGMVVLALSAARLLWRLAVRPPADLPMTPWQRRAAHITHQAMYLLFFGVPLTGWAYSSATGFPIVVFGVLPLPDFVPVDRTLALALRPWHEWLSWAMAVLVAAHVAAALKHHWVDRDGILSRMWLAKA